MKRIYIALFIPLVALFFSCSKEEGKGGLASINGVVMVQSVNYHSGEHFGTLSPAQDERVFILYGDNTTIGNDTRTSFNGSFEFPFLVQGNYTVFALSDDTENVNGESIGIKKQVSLNSKRASVKTDTIIVYKFVKFDKGSSSISGKVMRPDDFPPSTVIVPDSVVGNNIVQDIEVYLTLQGSSEILERTRTDSNGEFMFNHLIQASYWVYILKSIDYLPSKVVGKNVSITENNTHISLDPFMIEKK
ncbi:MAG: hypothetical protein LBU90_08680 [Bacteroidales bacterium]|jgi:hypothetical protein|nr:hypothetical protein [Bacteroidales bacterium]